MSKGQQLMKTKIVRNTLLSLGVIFTLAAALPVQLAGKPSRAQHPRYKLIDLGTLGGPNSSQTAPAQSLNNRGQVIAISGTAVPDPYAPNCFQDDCFVWHAVVREINGVVTDLGALPGVNNSVPTWITETGLIAGLSENGLIDPLTGFPELRAVLWNQNRTIVDLGTLGGNFSQAFGANNSGQAVGVALNAISENPDFAQFMNEAPAATQARAFLYQNGSMQDLGTLGGNDAAALVVNESGQVAGYSYTNSTPNPTTGIPTVHPFLWTNGQMQDLGSLGGTIALPSRSPLESPPGGPILNNRGQVVGTSTLAGDDTEHAFLWTSATMIDLGTLGGDGSQALAINEAGQVVGRADFSPTSPFHHAFLWQHGTMTDLGVVAPCQNSTAVGINSRGQVIADMGACGGEGSAFVWQAGQPITDLNTLVSPPSDLHIEGVAYINERGEIAGIATNADGDTRAVLLIPLRGP
jgi:probable HAF family extracellular repeat protein